MKNEKLRVRRGSLAYEVGLRHSSFKTFCFLFEINFKEKMDKDSYMCAELAGQIRKYEFIARMYNRDYYSDKTPKYIADLFQRKEEDVLRAIKEIDPSYFSQGEFTEKKIHSLRYISSFEIDKYLGGNYDFLSYREI